MVIDLRKKKLYLTLGIILILSWILFTNFFWKFFYPIPYRELIREYSEQNNLDPFLVAAVIRAESKFDPKAVSPRGARGMMQIMPETANWLAEQQNIEEFEIEQLFDAETNVMLGTWYLANLKKQFGDEIVVLAAYNGGRGNVKKWLENSRWTGEERTVNDIPFKETRDYVKKVINFRQTYIDVYNGKF